MKDMDIYEKIKSSVDSIFSYALKRTNNRYEAEDLSQEIIMNLYKSANSLKNPDAYYGWMWAVAGNVYKSFLRKSAKNTNLELNDDTCCHFHVRPEDNLVSKEEIGLLYREISMLAGLYRETMLLYYMKQKSCEEISQLLGISIDMVKQYLFKSRKKVKEGINMIRESGKRSFDPERFYMYFWGEGSNNCAKLFRRKLPGNIMLQTYYEPASVEQLAIELGVSAVYLEDEIEILLENELMRKMKNNRFQANIVIFTKEFEQDLYNKMGQVYANTARYLYETINEKEDEIRSVGFKGNSMSKNALLWQMSNICLLEALVIKLENRIIKELPLLSDGNSGYYCGIERVFGDNDFDFGINGHIDKTGNRLHTVDYYLFKKRYYELCKPVTGDVVLKIASGEFNDLNEYEEDELARLVQDGFIGNIDDKLSLNMPIFTSEELAKLRRVLEPIISRIYSDCNNQLKATEDILKNHVPKYLHGQLYVMAYLKQLEAFILNVISNMYLNEYIDIPKFSNEALAAYIVLAR